jgi:hypothetical protein
MISKIQFLPTGMIEHLRLISQATAKDRQALVIVDRTGWHMTKAIRCFSNVTLLPLPPIVNLIPNSKKTKPKNSTPYYTNF